MAMDFSSKEVEPRLRRGLSTDSHALFSGLLKTATKDIYIYKMSHFNFYYFYFTPYLIYNHNTASRTEDPGKVFGLQHLHLKNYFKTEN